MPQPQTCLGAQSVPVNKHLSCVQVFKSHDVTLAELSVMRDKDLERLKIPLGPRIRILQELKKLQPLNKGTVI